VHPDGVEGTRSHAGAGLAAPPSRPKLTGVRPRGLRELLFGRPLRTEEAQQQKVGPLAAVPVLGLDALGSAAYGPEALLTVLIPLGVAGLRRVIPLTLLIVVLLAIVQASYRQTIREYPDAGGSYTVAASNLGMWPGLLAGSALWIDYVLNVAVAISAGVGALVSAVPSLLPHTLGLCLLILALLLVVNLRGVREAGLALMAPTYVFVACLGAVVVVGMIRVLGGHPTPLARPPVLPPAVAASSAWVLMRAFASGCTAMTGVEAVSNAVPIFREPRVRNALRTLLAIVVILGVLVIGLAFLCPAYHIGATEPGHAGYESVLSQITGAVMGKGVIYYVTIGAIVAVLCLSANTSFAGFPRLCRVLALDGFLPADFAHQGARLVYTRGIVLLTVVAAVLLVVFRGVTDRLIPLFAVGAFLAFTMSQAGMVAHWRKQKGRGRGAMVLNAVGAVATAGTLVVILVSKLVEGAWITLLVLGLLLVLFRAMRAHLAAVDRETASSDPLDLSDLQRPLVVVPLKRLDRVARKALRFAHAVSADVVAVQVLAASHDEHDLTALWPSLVEEPSRRAGLPPPKLVVLRSAFREVLEPLLEHVQRLALTHAGRPIAVIVPELVERRWYHLFLHSHTATLLKALLLFRGGPQVVVINTPWYVAVGRASQPSGIARRHVEPLGRT
jgi:amino acid transporter